MPTLNAIPVFYSTALLAEFASFSPSALKPRAVVESWRQLGIPLRIQAPDPVGVEDYGLVHDQEYLEGVLSGRILNGFGNREPAVVASLAFTNGAMLGAAREALANGQVAVAACSGFHHAGYAYGGAYCTFNGLLVAARKLLIEGRVQRVGILDFDMHYGDGTEDIIQRLQLQASIAHYSAGAHWMHPTQAEAFLNAIPQIIAELGNCDLILYQAGADPHIDDPLGGFLSSEQLRLRDEQVFFQARQRGIPIAWNLAGGYQRDESGSIRPVLVLHDQSMRECARAFVASTTQESCICC